MILLVIMSTDCWKPFMSFMALHHHIIPASALIKSRPLHYSCCTEICGGHLYSSFLKIFCVKRLFGVVAGSAIAQLVHRPPSHLGRSGGGGRTLGYCDLEVASLQLPYFNLQSSVFSNIYCRAISSFNH